MKLILRTIASSLALAVAVLSSPGQAGPIPEGVYNVIFTTSAFSKPIRLELPTLANPRELAAFQQAVHRGGMLSPIAPADHVDRNDPKVALACSMGLVTLRTVRTREGLAFDYAIPTPKLQKLAPHEKTGYWASYLGQNGLPAARRKLKSIDYRNRFKVNPMGMGERDEFAITFTYTVEATLPGLSLRLRPYKGKADALLDPEDGEWKLDKFSLGDEGSAELLKNVSSTQVACTPSVQAVNQSVRTRPSKAARTTAPSQGVGFVAIGDNTPIYASATATEVRAHVTEGTPLANAKGTILGFLVKQFALEEQNGRTHVVYLTQRKIRLGWVDTRALRRFAYDCSCSSGCDPFRDSLLHGSSWNKCFQKALAATTEAEGTTSPGPHRRVIGGPDERRP